MTVWAGMATLADRDAGPAIRSLLPQVDELRVTPGDGVGDQVKFAAIDEAPDDAVWVSVDDDLIYPADFVARLLDGLALYGGVVGFHGWRVTAAGGIGSVFHTFRDVPQAQRVDVLGTSSCAFRLADLRPAPEDFRAPNVADLWLALRARRDGVPMTVLPHRAQTFGYVTPPSTIWDATSQRTGSFLDGSRAKDEACRELAALVY